MSAFKLGFAGQHVREQGGRRAADVVAEQAAVAGMTVQEFASQQAAAARVATAEREAARRAAFSEQATQAPHYFEAAAGEVALAQVAQIAQVEFAGEMIDA